MAPVPEAPHGGARDRAAAPHRCPWRRRPADTAALPLNRRPPIHHTTSLFSAVEAERTTTAETPGPPATNPFLTPVFDETIRGAEDDFGDAPDR
ncbi:hypothetical protein [Streptomyces albus]|uniref:hypothetical protein n=1 Tax=Streptomyces albus TaxID=1888 RepID=UPI0004C513FD|nr:hypothetical protein [Streptomyces albus]